MPICRLATLFVGINGTPVTDAAQLRQELATIKPGDPVVFEVERESVLQYVVFHME
jgi:S1-C subfamily serine protease